MQPRFILFLVVVTGTLAACHSVQHKVEPAPVAQDVTPGSTFTVVKDFLIPSGDPAVYFQDSQLYPEGEIQPDNPFCQFTSGAAAPGGPRHGSIRAAIHGAGRAASIAFLSRGCHRRGLRT